MTVPIVFGDVAPDQALSVLLGEARCDWDTAPPHILELLRGRGYCEDTALVGAPQDERAIDRERGLALRQRDGPAPVARDGLTK